MTPAIETTGVRKGGDGAVADPVVLFDPPPLRRSFASGDVLRLLVGALLILGGGLVAELAQATIEGIEEDLLDAFDRLPDRLEEIILRIAQLFTSVVPAVALVVLLVRRRWRVALLLVLAAVAATLAMLLADAILIDGELAAFLDALRDDAPIARQAGYPDAQAIASTTAVVTLAAPWVSRRWKRVLWGGVLCLVVLRLLASTGPALDLVLALGVGTVVGSLILLVFGSPSSRPRPDELLEALRAAGIEPSVVHPPTERGTALRYEVTDVDGDAHAMVLRTPDERDSELLARLYRGLRFRASEVGASYTTLKHRIEHEALMLSLAERAGVRAPGVERIGTTVGRVGLPRSRRPRPCGPSPRPTSRSAGLLEDLWRQVRSLHSAGVAHRHLALETIRVDGAGRPWLSDFDGADAAPSERERARDVAELLTETGRVIGPDAAVEVAVEAMGADQVGPALRMLQPLALPPATRAHAKASGTLLEDLRAAVAARTGAPELELEELERIKPRTVLVVAASTLAFYSLLPQLANLEDTADAFTNAEPAWLIALLAASVVTFVFAAVSFQGAVAEPVPFAANLRAQVAASFTGLVGPAGAGRFALVARFLERAGVGASEAGASVAVNTVAGFVVHLSIMLLFFVWTGASNVGGFSLPDADTVLLILAVLLMVVGVAAAFRPVRRGVLVPAWGSVRTGAGQIGRVFQSPVRVAALLGGSIGTTLTYVAAVAFTIRGLRRRSHAAADGSCLPRRGGDRDARPDPWWARGLRVGADRGSHRLRPRLWDRGVRHLDLPPRHLLAADPPGLVRLRVDAAQPGAVRPGRDEAPAGGSDAFDPPPPGPSLLGSRGR